LAVKYLAGDRLIGTAAERVALTTGGLGSAVDGTNHGADTGQTGKIGSYAWNFSGNDGNNSGAHDYVEANALAGNTAAGATVRSMSVWVKQNNNSNQNNDGWILTWGDNDTSSGGNDFFVIMDDWGYLNVRIRDGTTNTYFFEGRSSGQVFLDHDWHHIVVTMGTEVKFYLDGTNIPSSGWGNTNDLTAWIHTDMETFTIGSSGGAEVFEKSFDGLIDQLLIYSDELTQSEVTALWNSGSGDTTPDGDNLIAHYNFEQTGSTLENISVAIHPNLPNGAIFEESDTGKHYMFNGTSAWNEIT